MKTRLLWLIAAAFLSGCAHDVPTWSKANAEARDSGMFIPDDAYYQSQQYARETVESGLTVIRLRQQLGRDQAKTARESLNASLSSQQKAKATEAVARQQTWEARTFEGSPSVTAKVTTMVNPMDAKGRIMEQQILTYYDNGTMRYATYRERIFEKLNITTLPELIHYALHHNVVKNLNDQPKKNVLHLPTAAHAPRSYSLR